MNNIVFKLTATVILTSLLTTLLTLIKRKTEEPYSNKYLKYIYLLHLGPHTLSGYTPLSRMLPDQCFFHYQHFKKTKQKQQQRTVMVKSPQGSPQQIDVQVKVGMGSQGPVQGRHPTTRRLLPRHT